MPQISISPELADTIFRILLFGLTIVGATLAALWLSMVIWTFKEIHARSRDPFAWILATLVVAILTVPGLLVYRILRPRETLDEVYERTLEEEALLQEIESRATCPNCGRDVQTDWRLCPHCQTRLRKPCPNCSRLLELQWNTCPYCGQTSIPGSPEIAYSNGRPAVPVPAPE